jgi:hypothetical protein
LIVEKKSGRKIEKGIELVRRRGKNGKTTLPRILRPYLTIVNSGLYDFRFLGPPKRKKRLIHQPEQGD